MSKLRNIVLVCFFCCFRSTPLPLASYQYSHQFTVPHLITASHGVTTLSVSHDGRLLIVAQYGQNKSYIYNTSGSYVSTIQVPGKHSIRDAVWAPHGDNIMITCEYGSSLWLVSATGTVISETGFVTPAELSVSPGGVIYLTHHRFGIFESKDDGKSWYSLIRQFDIVKYQHAIRVPVDEQSYDIWTIVRIDEARDSYRLRIYSLPSGSNKVPNRGRDLAVPNCRLEDFSRLAFDGHSHVYITESFGAGVHEWSVTSYHERQLLQTADSRRLSYRVTVDTRRHVLYVGQVSGIVSVFTRQ